MKHARRAMLYAALLSLAGVAIVAAMSPAGFETWHKIVVALSATALTLLVVYEPRDDGDTRPQTMLPVDPYERPDEELVAEFDHYAQEALGAARQAFVTALLVEREIGGDTHERVHTALAHAVSDFAESLCVQMDTLITGSTMDDEPIDEIGQAVFYAYEDGRR